MAAMLVPLPETSSDSNTLVLGHYPASRYPMTNFVRANVLTCTDAAGPGGDLLRRVAETTRGNQSQPL